jgi:hypothetical protein
LADARFGSQAQLEPLWAISVFETAPFNHSGTSPPACLHEFAGLPASAAEGDAYSDVSEAALR